MGCDSYFGYSVIVELHYSITTLASASSTSDNVSNFE